MSSFRSLVVYALLTIGLTAACKSGDRSPTGPSGPPAATRGAIAGRATDAAGGVGLAGVAVSTDPATSTVSTDASGNFSIAGVAAGNYTLRAALDGYMPQSTNATVIAGQTTTANLSMPRALGSISGRVTDMATGSGLSGAAITTQPATATIMSDGQGNYSIPNVPPGTYAVTASRSGYTAQTNAGVAVTAGQTSTRDFALAPIPNVDGTYRGVTSQGRNISFTVANGAITTFSFGYTATGGCTVTGGIVINFTTPLRITGSTFTVTSSGGPPQALSLTVNGSFRSDRTVGGDASFTLVTSAPLPPCNASGSATWSAAPAPPGGSIAGKITDSATGLPITGASVTTTPATQTVLTNAQGDYSIADVAPGGYTVSASRAGYSSQNATVSVASNQTATANLALTPLPTTGTIAGTVTDATTGQPIAGATVSTAPATSSMTTNAQGAYTIPNVAPGNYSVTASRAGYVPQTSTGAFVTAGQTTTRNFALVPVPTTGSISGKVTDQVTGLPIASANVSTNPATSAVTTDGQGNYTIGNVMPGGYNVTATRAGYSAASQSVNVSAGQTATANLVLAPLPTVGTLAGTVTDANTSLPVAGAVVTTSPATSTVSTNGAGAYTISNVAPGTYSVTVTHGSFTTQTASGVVVNAGQTTTRNFALAPTASYAGNWSGMTSQNRPISFVVVGSSVTSLTLGWSATGTCTVSGTTTTSFRGGGRPIVGGAVTLSASTGGPAALSYTVNVTFNSTSAASGTVNVTFTQTAPLPPCSATGSGTFSAAKP